MGITFPTSDNGLLAWSLHFVDTLTPEAAACGVSPVTLAAYQAAHDAFAEAMAKADPNVRSKTLTAEKNEARDVLKINARRVASIIDGQANVTDPMKIELGMTVRSAPVPIPAPAFSPTVEITSVVGHLVSVRVHGPNTTRRGLPDGCDGIAVFSFVGEICPTDPSKFSFEANTTKMQFNIQFPESVVPGSTVWITAMFFNERKQSGVAANPISTKINFGGMQQTA